MEKKSILLVDDEPDIISELSQFLEHHGYDVLTAANGKEAVSAYKKNKPDVIISDYRMPVMNGFELMLKIKGINKNAKVILMSAVVDLDPFVMVKDSSAYDFIQKPIDLQELLKLL